MFSVRAAEAELDIFPSLEDKRGARKRRDQAGASARWLRGYPWRADRRNTPDMPDLRLDARALGS